MKPEHLYEHVRALMAIRDERDISDPARAWASDELKIVEDATVQIEPEVLGAWRASLELAFDAGRLYAERHAQWGLR